MPQIRRNTISIWALLSLVILMVSSISAGAFEANQSYPKPSGNLLSDFANMFSQDDAIEERLLQLEKASGVQLAVVTVESLMGDSIENYAVGLFQSWGIGEKGKDNGLLLLITKEERRMKFEVGYGLEPSIPDAFAGSLIDSILRPRFAKGEYDLGVIESINAIAERLGVDLGEAPDVKSEEDFDYIDLIVIIVILIILSLGSSRGRGIMGRGPRIGPLPPFGGGSSGGRGGGFGGFGGGRSGGGGASGGW